jgi:hypothetical protein
MRGFSDLWPGRSILWEIGLYVALFLLLLGFAAHKLMPRLEAFLFP